MMKSACCILMVSFTVLAPGSGCKAYLETHPVVELAQFRFKTWEDGLGNRCKSDGLDNEGQPDY